MSKNEEEQRVQQWLKSQGYTDIRDLSRTNEDPPDFVVDNRIGVEVRRLNWMTDANGKNQGAEGLEKPLEKTISKVLEAVGEPPGGYSVEVSCDLLDTSLPETDETERQVGRAVDRYVKKLNKALQCGRAPVSWEKRLECKLDIHFQPFLTSEPGEFVLMPVEAATHLRGWQIPDSIDNINRCIADKTCKIKDIICCYPEWWLVLVDHNVYTPGNWEAAWDTIRNDLGDTKPWSRIVVLSKTEPSTHVDMI